jgi:hypothetical protein
VVSNIARVVAETGIDDWKHDPWGCAMAVHFAICDVLDATGGQGVALSNWDYRRGAATVPASLAELAALEDGDPAASLAAAVIDGSLTVESLVSAGDVLARFESLVKLAGRDY